MDEYFIMKTSSISVWHGTFHISLNSYSNLFITHQTSTDSTMEQYLDAKNEKFTQNIKVLKILIFLSKEKNL